MHNHLRKVVGLLEGKPVEAPNRVYEATVAHDPDCDIFKAEGNNRCNCDPDVSLEVRTGKPLEHKWEGKGKPSKVVRKTIEYLSSHNLTDVKGTYDATGVHASGCAALSGGVCDCDIFVFICWRSIKQPKL